MGSLANLRTSTCILQLERFCDCAGIFRICNEALGRLGPAVTDQYPLAMLFDGSYVRVGTDLLPANIGSNTAPIVGGGVFDLDASLDASGVDINAFLAGLRRKRFLGARR